jgi:hypothetical protein
VAVAIRVDATIRLMKATFWVASTLQSLVGVLSTIKRQTPRSDGSPIMFTKPFRLLVLAASCALLFNACGSTSATGNDCSIKCDDAHNTCVKKCNDDTCTTKCETDLTNCQASCDKVKTNTGGTGG